jgi:uncharacterized protein YkwD
MNWMSKGFRRRRVPLRVELLEARQSLSGGAAAGMVDVLSGLFLAAEAAQASLESSGRVSTPESSQAVGSLRLPNGKSPPGPSLRRHPLRARSIPAGLVAHARSRPIQQGLSLGSLVVAPPPGPLNSSDARFIARAISQNGSVVTQAIVDLTNYVRAQNQVPPLNESPALMEGAQLHSQDMARLDQMLHDIPGVGLSSLPDRAAYVHYSYQLLGENIAYNQADAASAVASWMNSPPHRENMLNPSFTDIGVGLAWNSRGEPYYTMMLGKPA